MTLHRRSFLGLSATAACTMGFGAFIPRIASAAGARDPRFVTIVLRGGLDGLAAVPPTGDPAFADLRGQISADMGTPLRLNSGFGLHPAMPNLARLYKAGHATIFHACATPYRDRSHFDGQDVLESGFSTPGHTDSGWMNRLLEVLPAGQRANGRGLAVGSTTPVILRGPASVLGWAPSTIALKDDNLPPRILALYQDSDPALASAFDAAIATGKLVEGEGRLPQATTPLAAMASGAGRLLAADDGPRIAAVSIIGWDTHVSETTKLAGLLSQLDSALAAFETELGPKWRDTTILIATEFGRTVAVNGTQGTDHGTATTAFLVGGAVKGGQVIADWPGLKSNQLYEGRDLAPTLDLRAVTKGILAEQFDLSASVLADKIFPDSAGIKASLGLIV